MMKMMLAGALLAVLSVSAVGQTMYKCPDSSGSGAVRFQQTPCSLASGGEQITATKPSTDQEPGISTNVSPDDELLEKQKRNATVADSMTRQDMLYWEGGLAGMGSGGSSSNSGRRGPVHVRSYTRSNGTFVHSHTRSLPSRH